MPIEPRHLLDLARRLIGPAPGAIEADLRRGISTAYYALFHLLIKEAMTSFVTDPSFRPRVARALQHGPMKSVCEKYNPARPNGAGQFVTQQSHGFPAQIIAPDVRQIAAAFIALHEAREQADYDDGATITLAPKKLIRTRRASEGSASEPSLARRVNPSSRPRRHPHGP